MSNIVFLDEYLQESDIKFYERKFKGRLEKLNKEDEERWQSVLVDDKKALENFMCYFLFKIVIRILQIDCLQLDFML